MLSNSWQANAILLDPIECRQHRLLGYLQQQQQQNLLAAYQTQAIAAIKR